MRPSLAFTTTLLTFSLALAFSVSSCGPDTGENAASSSSSSSGSGGSSSSTGGGGTDGGSGGALLDTDCDPLVPTKCGYPFPSNVYLTDDPKTVTGKHVAFGKHTLPSLAVSGNANPDSFAINDGFSAGAAALTHIPGATVTGLPTQDNIDLSITTKSPTILLDADSGELIPHFAELDVSSDVKDDNDHAFMIRPVVRLKDKTRYIVAIRSVVDANNTPIPPTPAFQDLRDGTMKSGEPSVGLRRALYDDIFARLKKAGIPKGDLQIAWDYTTASRESNTRWLVHMRDDALAKVGADGPQYVIDAAEENPNQYLRRRIHGHMTVPLYLDKAGPGGRLVFGADGLPKQNGTADYEFLVLIPNSLVKNGTKGPPLQNGHGLLGDKTEGQNGYLARLADQKGYVAFGVDLIGMAEEDTPSVMNVLAGDIGGFQQLIERQHQGILNSLLAMRMMKGAFGKDPLVTFNGKSVIDPTECYYRGDSQGGIFGTTYMALTTDVSRGLLGEPGGPYSLLLNRSVDFDPFFQLLEVLYKDGRDIQLTLGLLQMLWDRTEPSGYMSYITQNMLPGTPHHDVLLHVAIGDHQVTPLGAHIIGRAVGAKNVKAVNRTIFGIPNADGPFVGSGMVEFSFGLPESPKTNTPPEGAMFPDSDDPHDKVRVLQAAFDSTDKFLRSGSIVQYCTGACDPE